ncbi:hypothetical protein [Taibaiella soli]|uniref:Uncharacterized protein n=1 Tax=Taibaiella soli TaxID=1649169 RepID=A0A2W2BCX4_9BACT|nr:hypothetical protein [Taibaiella soli]PZF74089.1 hypothetical protein DN068_05205 [Taibaiella soli]
MQIRKLIMLLLLLLTFKGTACDCVLSMWVHMANAKMVFVGEVIGVRNLRDSIGLYEIEFKVIRWLKGEQKTTKCKVYEEDLYAAGCGIGFDMGVEYEVYVRPWPAAPESQLLSVNTCSDTHRLAETWNDANQVYIDTTKAYIDTTKIK